MKYCYLSLMFVLSMVTYAQLGFCPGNTGDPIFVEDFGQGVTNGPPLPASVTNYNYVNNMPFDGSYTISSNLQQLSTFHNIGDHTGNQNGKALIVNADFTAGLFYQIPISGLCENNSYEFSAFLINVLDTSFNACPNNGIPVNVKFQIWDSTDTNLLAEGDTGNINGTSTPIWQQFGLTFTTLEGQTEVILKMLNNGDGGCGNDLAIDDIIFRSCGDETEVVYNDANTFNFCEGDNFNPITINAIPDFSIYNQHFYQWQTSQDQENWTNITGETASTLTINNATGTSFYRALVAEDQINVEITECNSVSNIFTIEELSVFDPVSLGDVEVCEGESEAIAVQNNSTISINWYDAPTGGSLLAQDSYSYQPNSEGVYYAEAISVSNNCINPDRVAVEYSITPLIDPVSLGDVEVCENETGVLEIQQNPNISINWYDAPNNGNLLQNNAFTYAPTESGLYYAEAITNNNNCVNPNRVEVSFTIIPLIAPESLGDVVVCEGESGILAVENNPNFTVDWYDAQTNGNLLQTNTFDFAPSTSGTYYAEAVPINGSCVNTNRIPLNYTEIDFISPVSLGDVVICEAEPEPLVVEENNNISVNWYDADTNGTLLAEDTFTFQPETPGTYYAEATTLEENCTNPNRVAINYSISENPPQFTENYVICSGETITLNANGGTSYLWSNSELTQSITVSEAGTYTVEVSNTLNCTSIQTFNVEVNQAPTIESVESLGTGIQINMQSNGDFSFAINDLPFQNSAFFTSVEGGLKTITVRENNQCGQDQIEFLHLVIPEFFSPNNDGINDLFEVNDANLADPYTIKIFNRYGKLLAQGENESFTWNGQVNGNAATTGDYWYHIIIGEKKFTGNFTLKR